MRRRPISFWLFAQAVITWGMCCAAHAQGAEDTPVDGAFFTQKVYPVLHAAQCVRCHNDNGVASETALEFPRADASEAQIAAFGLSLLDYVDRAQPHQSL